MINRRVLTVLKIVMVVFANCVCAHADSCSSIKLPERITKILQADFSGWIIVTPRELNTYDRRTWLDNYSKECPGLIAGHFTGKSIGYAVNLIRRGRKKTQQQILYFMPVEEDFMMMRFSPPSRVDVVSVIRKFAPGIYKSPDSAKAIKALFDTIGVSEIDAGTFVYYWNGSKFRYITTSE